jgi:hypothetical protein
MDIKKMPKNAVLFVCEICDFRCSKKSNYEKHVLTAKHKKHINGYNNDIQETQKTSGKEEICECGKIYNYYSGLWRHKKKCNYISEPLPPPPPPPVEEKPDIVDLLINENKEFKNVIIELFKSNSDLQKQMLEVCKNSNTTNINNNNSHNKTFNLQIFLNEHCKDAMNIMDFVDTFQLQFSDLERVGEVGYVEGISSLIIDKLNGMDINKRPIHCSDAKREIMYVKDKDVWERDTENNDKLRLAIKHITKKNMDLIGPWVEKHPGVREYDHRLNDTYTIIIIESMGGRKNDTMHEGESKIIKKISKTVLIDKNYIKSL